MCLCLTTFLKAKAFLSAEIKTIMKLFHHYWLLKIHKLNNMNWKKNKKNEGVRLDANVSTEASFPFTLGLVSANFQLSFQKGI